MRIAIRADGGPELGVGHIVRSNVLAKKFLDNGYEVTYLTKTPETVANLCSTEIEVYRLDPRNPQKDAVTWTENTGTKIIVSDCYEVDDSIQEAIDDITDCFVVIQSSDRNKICCDILVNGNIHGPKVEYEWQGTEPTWCVGLDYLLLRKEFRELANESTKWRETPKKAIVSVGGSDVNNITPDVMRAFKGLNVTVDVIIGPGFDNKGHIENAASKTSSCFNLLENPQNLPELMSNADFAVSGFGTTVYELVSAGTPIIGVPVVDNQKHTARTFNNQNLAIVAKSQEDLYRVIRKLYDDDELRRNLYEKYTSLLDGEGVNRIYTEITSFI